MATMDNDPLFTSLCSSKTLQSSSEGFFDEFYQTVAQNFSGKNAHWLRDVFAKQIPPGDDAGRLRLIYDDPTVCFEVLGTLEHVRSVFRGKDAKFSWQRREQARKLLNEPGKTAQALVLASQAVMRAPERGIDEQIDQGMTLACALWTRAEVLLKAGDGKRALVDLQMAAKAGFPVKEGGEYYGRMARCYAVMNDPKRAEVSAKLFHQLSGYNDYALGRLREDLEDLRILKSEEPPSQDDSVRKLPELPGKNAELPHASNKLALSGTREDTTKGRFIVAAQDLKPAEPIVVEPAIGACLYTKFFGSHCNACFAKLVAPVACPQCAGVAFCSPECRDRACSGYHRFECQYLDLLIGSGMSVLCHLALRLVTQAGTPEKAIELGAELKQTLCAHEDRREPADYFQRTLMAAFLLRCLQKAEFFGRRKTEAAEPTPLEAQVGGVLLSLLQSLQFNAHEIYETKIAGEHRIDTAKVQYVGVGVYRTSSMFNHECYPGVSRTFHGTTMCLYTSRPFAAGATIPENYGMHFIRHPVAVRQRTLRSRYWFGCECRACQENWPLMDKLTDKPRMRCPYPDCDNTLNFPSKKDPKVKCWKCKRYGNLENSLMMLDQCEDLYTKGAGAMADQRIDDAIDLLSQGIALFHKIAVPPHKSTHVAEESLRVCFADKGSINRV